MSRQSSANGRARWARRSLLSLRSVAGMPTRYSVSVDVGGSSVPTLADPAKLGVQNIADAPERQRRVAVGASRVAEVDARSSGRAQDRNRSTASSRLCGPHAASPLRSVVTPYDKPVLFGAMDLLAIQSSVFDARAVEVDTDGPTRIVSVSIRTPYDASILRPTGPHTKPAAGATRPSTPLAERIPQRPLCSRVSSEDQRQNGDAVRAPYGGACRAKQQRLDPE